MTLTFGDQSKWVFTPVGTGFSKYMLTQMRNLLDQPLNIVRNTASPYRVNFVRSSDATNLLTFNYSGNLLLDIRDSYGRKIRYGFNESNELSKVSQILAVADNSFPETWVYGYMGTGNRRFLSKVDIIDPTDGAGYSTRADVNYDTASGQVISLPDGNGNQTFFTYGGGAQILVQDSNGNVAQSWSQNIFGFKDAGITDANGFHSSILYEEADAPFSATKAYNRNASNQPTTMEYENIPSVSGKVNLKTVTGARGIVSNIEYYYPSAGQAGNPQFPLGFPKRVYESIGSSSKIATSFEYITSGVTRGLVSKVVSPKPGSIATNGTGNGP